MIRARLSYGLGGILRVFCGRKSLTAESAEDSQSSLISPRDFGQSVSGFRLDTVGKLPSLQDLAIQSEIPTT